MIINEISLVTDKIGIAEQFKNYFENQTRQNIK